MEKLRCLSSKPCTLYLPLLFFWCASVVGGPARFQVYSWISENGKPDISFPEDGKKVFLTVATRKDDPREEAGYPVSYPELGEVFVHFFQLPDNGALVSRTTLLNRESAEMHYAVSNPTPFPSISYRTTLGTGKKMLSTQLLLETPNDTGLRERLIESRAKQEPPTSYRCREEHFNLPLSFSEDGKINYHFDKSTPVLALYPNEKEPRKLSYEFTWNVENKKSGPMFIEDLKTKNHALAVVLESRREWPTRERLKLMAGVNHYFKKPGAKGDESTDFEVHRTYQSDIDLYATEFHVQSLVSPPDSTPTAPYVRGAQLKCRAVPAEKAEEEEREAESQEATERIASVPPKLKRLASPTAIDSGSRNN